MNEYDTHTIQSELVAGGHDLVDDPKDAELIIMNTCAIRGKPVEKVVTMLGELRKTKRTGRELTVALMGCLAQLDEGQALADKFGVDILLGPGAITDILPAIEAIEFSGSYRNLEFDKALETHLTPAPNSLTGFLTIMRGCDHHCTYCIVPTTRGPEISRPVEVILKEAEAMREAGVQEIYLLGQNVNSYGLNDGSLPSFAELLRLVANTGIPRVKFTTSHPMNFTADIIQTIAETDNICNYIHLPVQSGSNRVLRRMAREYKRDRYIDLIGEIRAMIPDLVISTDIIVGFPGETEDDFQETLSLYDEVGFDQAYTFIYSARPGTPAHTHFEDLPKKVKTNRLQELIEHQKTWSLRSNRSYVGQSLRVLVRDLAKEDEFVVGHSDQNHTVLLPKKQVSRLGLHEVLISQATPHLLYGNLLDSSEAAFPLAMAS